MNDRGHHPGHQPGHHSGQLIETDPLECVPETLAERIAELERLVHELEAPHAYELEALRRELEQRLRAGQPA